MDVSESPAERFPRIRLDLQVDDRDLDEEVVRPQLRTLVSGNLIPVPETFSPIESYLLAEAAETDSRLAEAMARAEEGHITQYLAGGPAQIERYRTADPVARAVLHAAISARRLGWGQALPEGFLAEAAQAYLTALRCRPAGSPTPSTTTCCRCAEVPGAHCPG